MPRGVERKRDVDKVTDIICAAGGEIVGRTRLQKVAYLLELAGLGDGFSFEYRHYGPYSEELAIAARTAALLGLLKEEERPTSWGGFYSIFRVSGPSTKQEFAMAAAEADSVVLELAATAAFLAKENVSDPWGETARRKPEKADASRLEMAKSLYQSLAGIKTPHSLPVIQVPAKKGRGVGGMLAENPE